MFPIPKNPSQGDTSLWDVKGVSESRRFAAEDLMELVVSGVSRYCSNECMNDELPREPLKETVFKLHSKDTIRCM